MIYTLEKDRTVFESNPGLETNQIFAECTDRELRYIFLLYDIESPYIKMQFDDRQVKAALEAGYRKEPTGKRFDKNARHVLQGKSRRVQAAIQEFKEIQRASNSNFIVLNAVQAQIDRVVRFLETQDESELKPQQMVQMNKVAGGLEELIQTKVNIERILEIDDSKEEEEEQEVNIDLSMLDTVNQEQDA